MNTDSEIKTNVVIIDDDEITVAASATALEEFFNPVTFTSTEDALNNLEHCQPNVVVLDILMPELDGYETCRRLRAELPADKQPAVVFLSSLDSLENRLAAYDAGGDDFLLKPVVPEELLRKVQAMQAVVTERNRLQRERGSVQQMAMSFLTNLGEAGTELSFLRNAPNCPDSQALAELTLSTLHDYGLNSAIHYRVPWGNETYSMQDTASPLVQSLFANACKMERIFQFRTRLIINYPTVSLLIKNLPIEDEERCGRLRDYLAIVAEGCENNLRGLIIKRAVERHAHELETTALAVEEAIDNLRRQYQEQRQTTKQILQQMNAQITMRLVACDLSEFQEIQLQDELEQALKQAMALFENGLDFAGQLETLQTNLHVHQSLAN